MGKMSGHASVLFQSIREFTSSVFHYVINIIVINILIHYTEV